MKYLLTSLLLITFKFVYASNSITESNTKYREMCKKAATQAYYFQNFRFFSDYNSAVEMNEGKKFAEYLIQNASQETLEKMVTFQKLDAVGNPHLTNYPELGNFSGTTLRYIVIADHIKKLFNLPQNAKIAEIGAGFGGQCYVLSVLDTFSRYYIYDLPETEALIHKMMKNFCVQNVICMGITDPLPEQKIDLLISNYAFSECDKATQLDYFERVIKYADRGYVIYNQIAKSIYGIESLTPNEFMQLLETNGMNPKMHSELIPTADSNYLIMWDRTK